MNYLKMVWNRVLAMFVNSVKSGCPGGAVLLKQVSTTLHAWEGQNYCVCMATCKKSSLIW